MSCARLDVTTGLAWAPSAAPTCGHVAAVTSCSLCTRLTTAAHGEGKHLTVPLAACRCAMSPSSTIWLRAAVLYL